MGQSKNVLNLSSKTLTRPDQILKKFWGYSSFRPLQKEIIESILLQKDVVALLPTGGGKSVCFQVPALARPGICIVISPLVALMTDQVNTLHQKGIKAMALAGGVSFPDIDRMLNNCVHGNYKFLYLSPERIQQELVQERIRQMQVNLIAVDEAHCISQWGHDFRPAYTEISILRQIKQDAPFVALTATATEPVIDDIKEQLQLRDPSVYRKSFRRENLRYMVREVTNKDDALLRILQKNTSCSIIYVRTRKSSIETAELLCRNGFLATAFHGGLSTKEKTQRLQQWISNQNRIMVATSAFGMGIDKPDVRQVIHLHLPESLESYFQEAGRAGRDGKLANSIILTSRIDEAQLREQFLEVLPDPDFVRMIYRRLNSYFRIAYGEGEGEEFEFNFSEFCLRYRLNIPKTYNTLLLLDRCSVLIFSEQYRKKTRVQFLISGKKIAFYLRGNGKFDPVVQTILRTYAGIAQDKVQVDLESVADKAGITETEVLEVLSQLETEGIIILEQKKKDSRVNFLVPREDDQAINPLVPHIRHQISSKKQKLEAVLNYIKKTETCRTVQLLNYFGEQASNPCGICSVCRVSTMGKIHLRIIGLLKTRDQSAGALIEQIDFPEEDVVRVLRVMIDKKRIAKTPGNKLKLRNL